MNTKSALRYVLFAALAAAAAQAQMQDNREKRLTCENNGVSNNGGGDRARYCEIREQPLPAAGRLTIDAGHNGGATVRGWLQNDVLVRSRVEASADSDAQARAYASQVRVDAAAGQVRAEGPETAGNSSWSVSYEIFVPQTTDITLNTHNGGIVISDVRGRIEFSATNGGVRLQRIAGDVSGSTVNGGVVVELAGNSWEGRQLEVTTRNGGVVLSLPESYSAHIQTETVNGGIQSDFPITAQGNLKPHNLDFNVGSGGPLIHVSTTNGGVKVKRT